MSKAQKKLCPRCMSPMIEKETYLTCPICHFNKKIGESTPSTGIKYKETVDKKEDETLQIFQIAQSGPRKVSYLESTGIFIITDRVHDTIWIWKGQSVPASLAYKAGTESTKIKSSERMYSASIKHVDEGAEPHDFPIRKKGKAAQKVTTFDKPILYRVEKGELKEISKPVFTTGDSYVVDNGNNIYIWIGVNSSTDEKFSGALLSKIIDESRRGKPQITTIDQGTEHNYPDFYKLVSGLKIVEADVAESILKPVEKEVFDPVLYRVSSEEYDSINEMIYIQVPCKAESLDSEDVFLLDDRNTDTAFIWIGSRSTVKEKVVGGQISRKFEIERAGVQKEIFIEEGEEPEEFKRLLGIGEQVIG